MRLLVTDFDGTLVLDDRRPALPAAFLAFLASFVAGGGRWVIATGRDLGDTEPLLPALGVPVRPDALIVNDGAIHVDRGDTREWDAWNDARRARRARLFSRFEGRLNAFLDECLARGAGVWRPVDAPWGLEAPPAVLERCAERFASAFADTPALCLAGNGCWAAPAPRGDDKGAAVRALASRWGILPADTTVAGDDLNDLPMMHPRVARHWIAPANAVERVRKHVAGRGVVARLDGAEGVLSALTCSGRPPGWAHI
ncbi:MAG: HAD family hydrolase [Myxococcota bacterium]